MIASDHGLLSQHEDRVISTVHVAAKYYVILITDDIPGPKSLILVYKFDW